MAAVDSQEKESLLNDSVLFPDNKTSSRAGAGYVSNVFTSVGSSWSVLSSPFGSELGSTETESEEEDDEFMAELTRQMADYMLQEDDDESAVKECGPQKFELHKMENQPSVENQIKKCNKGLARGAESTQRSAAKRAEPTQGPERKKQHKKQYRAAAVWAPQQCHGSDMRAVFLSGPNSKTRTCGTGVFLPRGASNPPEDRNKSGCSTVLIPTRVLRVLQLHFQNVNSRPQSNSPNNPKSYRPQHDVNPEQTSRRSPSQSNYTNKNNDIGLPQEWTY